MPDTRFAVLGRLSVRHAGVCWPIADGKPRILLAALLLRPNQLVPVHELADRAWGRAEPLSGARRNVQVTIHRLRRALPDGDMVETMPGGYRIHVGADQLDLLRFRGLHAAAESATDTAEQATLLHAALGLWRGAVCEDIESDVLRRYDVPGIVEERLRALERRTEIDLGQGRGAELIGELRALTAEHPFRERLWMHLMAALHHGNRQAEALTAYRTLYRVLHDELGIEPAADVRDLHQRLLTGRVEGHPLLSAPRAERTGERVTPVPHQLPADVAHFVGRAAELRRLDAALRVDAGGPPALVVLDGPAGAGKTALAVRWSTTGADRFPGGRLFLDLRGFDPLPPMEPVTALHLLLAGLGVPSDAIPTDPDACAALFRSRTAGRGLLVVLDNARDSAQVEPLLPGAGCAVVVTSRNQLRGLVARSAAVRVSVGALSRPEALALLETAVGADRVAGEPAEARRVAELCDHSPLALLIAAERMSRLAGLTFAQLADEIGPGGGAEGLDAFDAADGDRTDLRAVLSWSYASLEPATARAFRLAGGAHPGGTVSAAAVAALCGVPVAQARRHLDRLAAGHFVEQTHPDRFRFHDLMRAYAGELATAHDGADGRHAAAVRLLSWYGHGLARVDEVLAPGRRRDPLPPTGFPPPPVPIHDLSTARRWCEDEYPTLIALPSWAASVGAHRHAAAIAHLLTVYLAYFQRWHDLVEVQRAGLAAADRAGDRTVRAHLLNGLGNAYAELRDHHRAEDAYRRALDAYQDTGDRLGRARVFADLGMLATERGELPAAERQCREALRLYTELGYARGRASVADSLGEIHLAHGDHAGAVACYRRALEINRTRDDRLVQITNLTNLGRAYAAAGRHRRAAAHLERALAIGRETGSGRGTAGALLHLGRAHRAGGDAAAAHAALTQAHTILARLDDPLAGEAQRVLADWYQSLRPTKS